MTQGGSVHSNLFLSMHIYEQFQQKIAFSGPRTPFIYSRDKTIVLKGSIFFKLPVQEQEHEHKAAYLPVTWSTRIREVIMRPYWEKSCSSSFWVIVLGSPLTYKFASLIEAELGRAQETLKEHKAARNWNSSKTLEIEHYSVSGQCDLLRSAKSYLAVRVKWLLVMTAITLPPKEHNTDHVEFDYMNSDINLNFKHYL